MLRITLVSLLLCGIFASELPELLSLTDNTANDFTMRSANPLVAPVLDGARNVLKATMKFNNPTQDSLFSRAVSPEKMEFAPLLHFILYSVLRT